MENSKKELTEKEIEVDNMQIIDALDTLNKLVEVGISKGMNIVQISAKAGINKQSVYRYISNYDSQPQALPTLKTILKLSEVFGYEIRIHKIKNEDVDN
tara:strand:+ start:1065 stop:1361 length:297 start_codon:yes stop_codon:yes gene_type:complete